MGVQSGALIGVPNWGPKLGSQIGVPKYPFVVVCLAVVVCYIKVKKIKEENWS
jgi:hypothetical protein